MTRLSSGIEGLDDVLRGGFLANRSYMVRGPPGSGKTLVGLHFLAAGEGDALFVNLGQSADDLRQDARNFGIDTDAFDVLDLSPTAEFFREDQGYEVFPSDEVADESVADDIVAAVDERDPDRVFVDPVTQFRYLSSDDFQFRKQVLSFLRFLKEEACTTLFTSQATEAHPDDDLQFMSDGIVHLDAGDRRRTLEVTKFRGSDFAGGRHGVRIHDGGMSVYPQLVPEDHHRAFEADQLSSGVGELDDLLHGGIERGTVTMISGPSGVGKTTTGAQFMQAAADRGERSVIYLFEEDRTTFLHRCSAIGIPVREMLEDGSLVVEEVEALDMSAEEFSATVRAEVEEHGTDVVMIDGVAGYRLSIRGGDDELTTKLHGLSKYLRNVGATTVLINEMPAITGEFRISEDNVSYLADNVLFLRYLEFEGELRKAIGVLKKRASDFERTLREFRITEDGLVIGDPLTGLRGVLSGTPEWSGDVPESLSGED